MAQNTVMATINASVNKEEITMKTKNEIREMLKAVGVEISNTVFKKTKKADLVATLEQHLKPVDEVKETVVEKKEGEDMKTKYMDPKWDKLIKTLASEYVKQSLGVKWALFYKNSKPTVTKSEYLVKSSKLWGATSKVIKTLYGETNCNEDHIQQALNAMVVRGYLNYQKVNGRDGSINVVFNATTDQMNAMYKLAKQ